MLHEASAGLLVSVAIADDDPAVRRALADLIESDSRLHLVGQAVDAPDAIAVCGRVRPDVMLIDLKMPGGGGVRAIEEIRNLWRKTACIALTAYEDRGSILRVIRAGAASYIVKGASGDVILSTIFDVHNGETQLAPDVAETIVEELAAQLRKDRQRSEGLRSNAAQVRRAIAGGGLSVVYQPIYKLADMSVAGYEALARFSPPGELSTKEWFEMAASTGLGAELEYAALDAALDEGHQLPAATWLAVNLSPACVLAPRFSSLGNDEVLAKLLVEITEHAPINDYEPIVAKLRGFRAQGGRVAVDDAGSGYSSLQHVLELEPDFIKLDISLCRDVQTKAKQRAVIASLVALAEATNCTVIAEGIESGDQQLALRDLGVTHGQGFHLGRPQTIGDVISAAHEDATAAAVAAEST